MATVMARGAMTTMNRGRPAEARPSHRLITLYELIAAIQDVVGTEDDTLVVATVGHLLRSGRLTEGGHGGAAQRTISGASRLGRPLPPSPTVDHAGAVGQSCCIP